MPTSLYPGVGVASLSVREMPDPTIPPDELTEEDAPQRILLGTDNAGSGALLFLNDSQGRPRIKLHVQGNDEPVIQVLDADGNVVAQLPPAPADGDTTSTQLGPGMQQEQTLPR